VEEFFTSGHIADVILVFLAVEVAVIGYVLWRQGQALGLLSFVASSLAGGSLVLALRAALLKSGWLFVAMYLLAALLAHLAEIAVRLLVARYASNQTTDDVSGTP
jgi:hypothetical protein